MIITTPSTAISRPCSKSKKGLPITLSLIYKIVADRLGLRAWGVGLPGHFLVGVESDGAKMLVDPFAGGRMLTADEAQIG